MLLSQKHLWSSVKAAAIASSKSKPKLTVCVLFCLVVVIAFYRAIRTVCIHNVYMIPIGIEGACQEKEEPSYHYVAPGCPYLMNRHILHHTFSRLENTK
jgi:hypothetical protein